MDITDEEADTLKALRDAAPCIALNAEALSILEQLTSSCPCHSCAFIRDYIAMIAVEESRGETSH